MRSLLITLLLILSVLTPVRAATPTIDVILANIEAKLATVKDISATLDAEQFSQDGSVTKMRLAVRAKLPDQMRVEFLSPETLAGMLYIFDQKANQATCYTPITEQAIITPIDNLLKAVNMSTSAKDLFGLPPKDTHDLAVVETSGNLVRVSAKPKAGGPVLHIWVDQQQWLVSRIDVYNAGGRLEIRTTLSGIKLNQGITDAQLRKLPAGTIVVRRD